MNVRAAEHAEASEGRDAAQERVQKLEAAQAHLESPAAGAAGGSSGDVCPETCVDTWSAVFKACADYCV